MCWPLGSQQVRWRRRSCQPEGRLRAEGRRHPADQVLPDARQEAADRSEGRGEGSEQALAPATRQGAAQQQEEQEGPQAAVRFGRHHQLGE